MPLCEFVIWAGVIKYHDTDAPHIYSMALFHTKDNLGRSVLHWHDPSLILVANNGFSKVAKIQATN